MYNVKVSTTGRVIYGVDTPVTTQTITVEKEQPLAALRMAIKAFKTWEEIPAEAEKENTMWQRLGEQIEKLDDMWTVFSPAARHGLEIAGMDLVREFQEFQANSDDPTITIEFVLVPPERKGGCMIG